MPAFTSISINDGQSTPVAHSFAPLNKEGSVATFVDRSPANAVGWKKIKHEVVTAKSVSAANRVKIDFIDPVLQTVDGILVKARQSSAQLVFNFAQNSTDQERKDLLAYVANWLNNATVKSSVQNIEPFYA